MAELPKHLDELNVSFKENLLFNLGGVINHNLYFNSMNLNKVLSNNNLIDLINNKYGNYNRFIKAFKEKALSLRFNKTKELMNVFERIIDELSYKVKKKI